MWRSFALSLSDGSAAMSVDGDGDARDEYFTFLTLDDEMIPTHPLIGCEARTWKRRGTVGRQVVWSCGSLKVRNCQPHLPSCLPETRCAHSVRAALNMSFVSPKRRAQPTPNAQCQEHSPRRMQASMSRNANMVWCSCEVSHSEIRIVERSAQHCNSLLSTESK